MKKQVSVWIQKFSIDRTAVFGAIFFDLLYCLGMLANDRLITRNRFFDGSGMGGLLFVSLLFFVLGYFLLKKCFLYIERSQTQRLFIQTSLLETLKVFFFHYWVLFLLAWLPYWLMRFPGNLDPDTFWQILQPYGLMAASDHHPWFDTMLFYKFWRIGDFLGSNLWSVAIYAWLQMAATAAAFSLFLCYIKAQGVRPRVIRTVAFFYALFPVIPLFAQTMAKDMLNGWIFVLFFLSVIECVRSRGAVLKSLRFCGILLILSFLMALTKKVGIYIVVVSLFGVFCYCSNGHRRILWIMFFYLVFFCGLWSHVVLPMWGVASGEQKEMLSIPSQQVACLIQREPRALSENDWQIIQGVYQKPRAMAQDYNPLRADATKSHWKKNASNTDRINFIKWYLKAWTRFPKTFCLSLAANDYGLLSVDATCQGDESLIYYRNNLPNQNGGYASEKIYARWSNGKASISQVHQIFKRAYRSIKVQRWADAFDMMLLHVENVAAVLFSKVLFATWLPFALVFYAIRSRRWNILIALIPVLLTTLTLSVGPVILPRYMVCSVYVAPIIFSLPFLLKKQEVSVATDQEFASDGCHRNRRKDNNCAKD